MRFYGQFEPPVDRYLLENFFADRTNPGFFVECGAFDGVYDSTCLMFEESLGWSGANIEASPVIFPLLERRRPRSTNLHLALSNKSGFATFRHVSDELHGDFLGWGSLKHGESQQKEIESVGMKVTEWTVQTSTWRDCAALQSIREIDLLVLDVEGHELAVIEGMIGAKVLPKVACVEHGQVGLDCLQGSLKKAGYDFVCSLHVNSFFTLRERT